MLPIGPGAHQVQAIRRAGKSDLLVLSAETEQWLRNGCRARMSSPAALRDLGPILAHGEPDDGMGQGESTDQAAHATEPTVADSAPPAEGAATPEQRPPANAATAAASSSPSTSARSGPTSHPPPDLETAGLCATRRLDCFRPHRRVRPPPEDLPDALAHHDDLQPVTPHIRRRRVPLDP